MTTASRHGKSPLARIDVRVAGMRKARFLYLAEARGRSGSEVINEFMAWYNREDGAELPERPAPDA